jgi:peroxiredoxin
MSTDGAGGQVVNEGDPAPPFDLQAGDGSQVRLEALKGQKVVLFFCPKDDTPGCTSGKKNRCMAGPTGGLSEARFLIGEDGTVLQVWRNAREVTAVLSSDPSNSTG